MRNKWVDNNPKKYSIAKNLELMQLALHDKANRADKDQLHYIWAAKPQMTTRRQVRLSAYLAVFWTFFFFFAAQA